VLGFMARRVLRNVLSNIEKKFSKHIEVYEYKDLLRIYVDNAEVIDKMSVRLLTMEDLRLNGVEIRVYEISLFIDLEF